MSQSNRNNFTIRQSHLRIYIWIICRWKGRIMGSSTENQTKLLPEKVVYASSETKLNSSIFLLD